MVPESTRNVPATAFKSVDLPEPFVPMMITNDPASNVRLTPCSERTSLGVPALKVLRTCSTLSMGGVPVLQLVEHSRQNQGHEDEGRGDQLQVVGIQAPAQR